MAAAHAVAHRLSGAFALHGQRQALSVLVALLANLDDIRREKVGTDNQEFIEGMVAVAVPVTDAKGRLAGTLACHGPTVRMSMERAQSFVPALRRAAAKLSQVGGEAASE